jgi:hypothetical protein
VGSCHDELAERLIYVLSGGASLFHNAGIYTRLVDAHL